jgi:Ner family transcriptional regulator
VKSLTPKQQATADWHPADIKAALAKADYTFARIARENGFKGSAQAVLARPWSTVEAIVGKILDVHPSKIWPSRYDAQGNRLKGLRRRGIVTVPKHGHRRNG